MYLCVCLHFSAKDHIPKQCKKTPRPSFQASSEFPCDVHCTRAATNNQNWLVAEVLLRVGESNDSIESLGRKHSPIFNPFKTHGLATYLWSQSDFNTEVCPKQGFSQKVSGDFFPKPNHGNWRKLRKHLPKTVIFHTMMMAKRVRQKNTCCSLFCSISIVSLIGASKVCGCEGKVEVDQR